ncbi:hypothetical protein H6G76_35770 [Nostoc sp. FACHB-152]|uniref:hypothetical protein n=1 Tax=unclassified Nostoc TaxID=2593658 RepID=UPI00168653A4|nr:MULTISPECIES: hypothetical protein [unclassified Nostoc]MBD2452368.1 hypothetical protein [Nostoc sp. FACHB-152]MBD2472978.1 hypothetical protein [Nostoc sp. FACHB-145]
MKNYDHPVTNTGWVRLSGVVTAPYADSQNGQWKEILISSVETRFKNVLARATVLQRLDWFWHSDSSMHLCEEAVALVAHNANDYRQILIKQNHLASTLPDLDPVAEVLLLVSPQSDYVFGTVLETGEKFSTHILFVQQKQYNRGANVQKCLGQNSTTVAQSNSDATPPSSLSFAGIGGSSI